MAEFAIRMRYATFAFCISLFILAFGLLLGGRLPFVFFPSPEAENVFATVTFYSGLPEDDAISAISKVERALLEAEKKLTGGDEKLIVASFVTLGKSGRSQGDNIARISVELTSSEVRTVRTPTIVRAWRAALPETPPRWTPPMSA